MADDFTGGLSSAVAAAVAAARLPLADVETLDLFTDPARAATAPRDAARRAVEEGRRQGRPRGSTNKRTAKWRDYLTTRYAHPLEVMAQTITRSPAELAGELGCTVFEAFQLQLKAAAELAPYLECKMPTLSVVAADSGITVLMPGINAPIGATMADLEALAQAGADFDLSGLDIEVLDTGAKVIDHDTGAKVDSATS